MNGIPPVIIDYDTEKWPFRKILSSILGTESLEKLHQLSPKYEVFSRSNDQSTAWHRIYYDNFARFRDNYESFAQEFVRPLFGVEPGNFIYQAIPNLRVHLVGNLGVGEWHRDSKYNHDKSEINCWLPFVNAYGTNTVWIESQVDENDCQPYSVKYGQVLVFNGAQLLHGNKINDTEDTRVSIDFRVSDKKHFRPSEGRSVNTNTVFDIGGYFKLA
jgi:hypothetical protein